MNIDRNIRQFRLNIEHWAVRVQAPPILWIPWPGPHEAAQARGVFRLTKAWEDFLHDTSKMTRMDHGIKHHKPWGLDTARKGYREAGVTLFAVQPIIHDKYVLDEPAVEIDVDAGNPATLPGAIVHGFEYLWHRIPKLLGRRKKFCGPLMVRTAWKRLRGWDIEAAL